MASQKQIKANQRNSKKSTGPRNTNKTKYNSLKHGILSENIILSQNGYKEDPKQFEAIRNAYYEEYSPKSITETFLVDRLTVCHWKILRCHKAERASITKELIEVPEEIVDNEVFYDSLNARKTANADYLHQMSKTILQKIVDYREEMYDDLKNKNASTKEMAEAMHIEIDESLTPEEQKEDVEIQIENVLNFYKAMIEVKEEQLNKKIDIGQEAAIVLRTENQERYSRYEKTLERQYYKILEELRQIKS